MIFRSENVLIETIIILIFANIITQVCSVEGDTDCTTSNNTKGYCINIIICRSFLDLLKNSNSNALTYLQSASCGFKGIFPLVCCAEDDQSDTPNPIQPTETTTVLKHSNASPNTENEPKLYTLPKAPNCGNSFGSTNRVVNGDPAKLGEFPWMAALGYRNLNNPKIPKWLCAGSLISDKHILTAGHCTYNRVDLYLARLGDLDLYSNDDGASPVDVLIAKIKIHEEYNPASITNDIAILTLISSVSGMYISPICLPFDEPLRTRNFVRYYPFVAGWGALYFDGPSSSHLMVVMLPVVSNDQCKEAYTNFKNIIIDDRSICAGYTTGGKDVCQGDSGGPLKLVYGQNPFSYYQIGIVSFGFRCAEEGVPGVYTRVTYFLDWIEKNVY